MKAPVNHLLILVINSAVVLALLILIWFAGVGLMLAFPSAFNQRQALPEVPGSAVPSGLWVAPALKTIPDNDHGKLIRYGRDLIVNTAAFLGPKGTVRAMSNGMNCQNCHLDAGTRHYGNNFSMVASTYPKFRPRYGAIESVERRVNDCLMRSLNGDSLERTSPEMRAIVAYILWVGQEVEKGDVPPGSGMIALPYLERAASPENGKSIYESRCAVCHGRNGEGMIKGDGTTWQNPPLWGANSYNVGAGMFRLSHFARYVKANMPFTIAYDAPQLTDEEAWDVAAYVNSKPRPDMDLSRDWPDILKKPPDYPFAPFFDNFSVEQHKYGPFKPIQDFMTKK